MPYINFDKAINSSGVLMNIGSVSKFVNYLDKENNGLVEDEKEQFFSHTGDNISNEEVIKNIDNNRAKLSKKDAKFYTISINPSKEELKHIGNDKEKLKAYTRSVMDLYAKNFNREKILGGGDLVYYAKIENFRKFKGEDLAVKNGYNKQGELKPGNNRHVHIIVSRKDKTNKIKLSPKDKAIGGNNYKVGKKTNSRSIKRGFPVNKFKNDAELLFDKMFEYERSLEEKFEYNNLKKNHPLKFQKQFNTPINEISSSVIEQGECSSFVIKNYIVEETERVVKNNTYNNNLKEELKSKGIKMTDKSLIYKKTTVKLNDDNFEKKVLKVLVAYKFIKRQIKKVENEKKQEEELEKEI